MPLHYLTVEDFRLERGQYGILLCHNIPGISFVFFDSHKCGYCNEFRGTYKHMHNALMGCSFASVNVSQQKALVKLSKKSNTPLKHVPYFILYVNGIPHKPYEGPRDPQAIVGFIMETLNAIKAQQSFSQPHERSHGHKRKKKKRKEGELPWGAIAYNVAGSDYKEYKKAYNK